MQPGSSHAVARVRAVGFAVVVLLGGVSAALGEPLVNLYYNPVTGNLTLQNTSGSTVKVSSYDILTLGDGTEGPATATSRGYLTGSAAAVPSPPPSFVVSNATAGLNGLASQIYGLSYDGSLLTLAPHPTWSPANPIGPAGSYFDFGNVAATGMTQGELNGRFITTAELSPGGVSLGGGFLFDYEVSAGTFAGTTPGNVVALVPEPSLMMFAGGAGLAWAAARVARRRITRARGTGVGVG